MSQISSAVSNKNLMAKRKVSTKLQAKVDKEKMQYIEELKQLRQLITKQEQEYQELQKQLADEKSKIEMLSNKEQALVKRIAEKTKVEQQMSVVMNEYEKNMAQLIAERESEKQKLEEQVQQMTSERDVAMQHLSSVESAFSDVHQKYERCKVVIEQFKANEETLKADNTNLRELAKQQDTRYDTLKAHAISQLDKANADLEALKRKHEMEMVKCTALLKKADLKTISLQESLTQKQKENEELMSICDGLIQKVG